MLAAVGPNHPMHVFGFVEDDDVTAGLNDLEAEWRIRLTRHAGGSAVGLWILEGEIVSKLIPLLERRGFVRNPFVRWIDNHAIPGRDLKAGRMRLDVPRRGPRLIVPVPLQIWFPFRCRGRIAWRVWRIYRRRLGPDKTARPWRDGHRKQCRYK